MHIYIRQSYASRFATDARKNAPRCWPLGPTEECVDAGDALGDSVRESERFKCPVCASRLKFLPTILGPNPNISM